MIVSVKFYGAQQAFTSTPQLDLPLSEGGCVRDVFNNVLDRYPKLSLCEEDILVSVNDKLTNMGQSLKPADNISFLPHIGGG